MNNKKVTITTKTGNNTYTSTEIDKTADLIITIAHFILTILFLPFILLFEDVLDTLKGK